MTGTKGMSIGGAVVAAGVALVVGVSSFALGDYAGTARTATLAQHELAEANARAWNAQTAYNAPEDSDCNGTVISGVIALDPTSSEAGGYNARGSALMLYLADPACTNGQIVGFNKAAAAAGVNKRLCREIDDPLTGLDVASGPSSCEVIGRER